MNLFQRLNVRKNYYETKLREYYENKSNNKELDHEKGLYYKKRLKDINDSLNKYFNLVYEKEYQVRELTDGLKESDKIRITDASKNLTKTDQKLYRFIEHKPIKRKVKEVENEPTI